MSTDRLSLIGRAKKWLKGIYYKVPSNDWGRYEARCKSTHSLLYLLACLNVRDCGYIGLKVSGASWKDYIWKVKDFVSRVGDRLD